MYLPKVSQAVALGLFSAELDLVVSNLTLGITIQQVSKSDLLCIHSLCVRKYSMAGNIIAEVLG